MTRPSYLSASASRTSGTLRHAHASWLLAGGVDIEIVKERLGHGSIVTTQRYLQSLPEADDVAVDAFTRIRNRNTTL